MAERGSDFLFWTFMVLAWLSYVDLPLVKLLAWLTLFCCAFSDFFLNNWDLEIEFSRLKRLFQ